MGKIISESEKIESNKINFNQFPQKFNFKKKKVVLVNLDNYEPENIRKALNKIIEILDLRDFLKNKSVLLKPNILAPTKNAFTPVEILVELIKLIKDDSKGIIVGDSSITKKFTSFTLKRTKIREKCEALGVKVINFFKSKREKVELRNPSHEIEKYIYLPIEVHEADLIINLPKLKTHNGYVYTGAIKNFFGLLSNKMVMHGALKDKNDFQKMLADIYFAVEETNNTKFPKILSIMDAVIAMEGKGPRSGKPRKVGLLIAGFNSAAIDIIGYSLMNGDPKDLEVINSIAVRTDLPVEISRLEIVGEKNYKDYIVKDFKKPKAAILKKGIDTKDGLSSKITSRAMSISIKINRKKCVLCQECVKNCPAEAMYRKKEVKKDKIFVNHEKCIECFCCGESCPNDAIDAKWYIFRIAPLLILLLSIVSILGIIGIWALIVFIFSF